MGRLSGGIQSNVDLEWFLKSRDHFGGPVERHMCHCGRALMLVSICALSLAMILNVILSYFVQVF